MSTIFKSIFVAAYVAVVAFILITFLTLIFLPELFVEMNGRLNSTYGAEDSDPDCTRTPPPIIPEPLKVNGILFMNYIDQADKGQSSDSESSNSIHMPNFMLRIVNPSHEEYGWIEKHRDQYWLPFLLFAHDNVDCVDCINFFKTPTFTFSEIAQVLGKFKYKFIEIQAPPKFVGKNITKFLEFGGTESAQYLTFSISRNGDPACLQSEKFFADAPPLEKNFRGGLLDFQCIAAQSSSTSKSEYAVRFENRPDERKVLSQYETPMMWEIVNLKNNLVYAQVLKKESAFYNCPTSPIRGKFWNVIVPNKNE